MYENPNEPLLYPSIEQRWICPTCNSDKNTQVVLNTCGHCICHVCYNNKKTCSLCEVKQVNIEAINVEEIEEIKQAYQWRVHRLQIIVLTLLCMLIMVGCFILLFYPFNVIEYTTCNILNCTMTNDTCKDIYRGKYNCIDYDIVIELEGYNKTIEYISNEDLDLCNNKQIRCYYKEDDMQKTLNIDVEE